MSRVVLLAPCALALLAGGLAGCASTDPLTRQGVWRPNYANDADLRAMVSQPADLLRGQGAAGSSGQQAATAIDHLREDKPKPPLAGGLALTAGSSSGGGS